MNGHLPFAIANRTVNRALAALLRSPAHAAVSRSYILITVTGRRTGRRHTLPVSYREDGGIVRIHVGWPEHKRWWRNLRGAGAPVTIVLRGATRTGHGVAHGDERSGVHVEVGLDPPGG